MTLEMMSFLLGALLALVGILGGGLEIKELKIPKLSSGNRFFALVGGLVFIVLGISLQRGNMIEPGPAGYTKPTISKPSTPSAPGFEEKAGQDKSDVVAHATHTYWEEVRKLDKYYEAKQNVLEEKSKYAQDVDSQIELHEAVAELLEEASEREGALPLQNVDIELADYLSRGRQLMKRAARNFSQKAYILRYASNLVDHGPISPQVQRGIMENMQKLDREGQSFIVEAERYEADGESLRIKLIQRYNREFSGG